LGSRKNAKEEVLIMFATANAFRRNIQMGILQQFNEVMHQSPNLKIKLLIPADESIAETIEYSKLKCPHVDFRIYEEGLTTGITILIDDKEECLMVASQAKDDDAKMDYRDFSALSLYSNSKSIVISFDNIISYWRQTEMY
jgi:hypothetical protein